MMRSILDLDFLTYNKLLNNSLDYDWWDISYFWLLPCEIKHDLL